MSQTNKNTGQGSVEHQDDLEVEYVDPAELSPIGNEELYTAEINAMVTEDAPRLFALCVEIGSRVDAMTIAWGMSFDHRAEVVSAADDGVRGVFTSAERARKILSAQDKIKVRLVWVDEAQEQAKAALDVLLP